MASLVYSSHWVRRVSDEPLFTISAGRQHSARLINAKSESKDQEKELKLTDNIIVRNVRSRSKVLELSSETMEKEIVSVDVLVRDDHVSQASVTRSI